MKNQQREYSGLQAHHIELMQDAVTDCNIDTRYVGNNATKPDGDE
jgi:hypothetical protein